MNDSPSRIELLDAVHGPGVGDTIIAPAPAPMLKRNDVSRSVKSMKCEIT